MITTTVQAVLLALCAACMFRARTYARRAEFSERAADKVMQRARHETRQAEIYARRAETARAETARLLGAVETEPGVDSVARDRVWRTLGIPAEATS